jgi:cysteinyl-tRNA synthetase
MDYNEERRIVKLYDGEPARYIGTVPVEDGYTSKKHLEVKYDADPLMQVILDVRSELRIREDYELADRIRVKLNKIGIYVEDRAGKKSTWHQSRKGDSDDVGEDDGD